LSIYIVIAIYSDIDLSAIRLSSLRRIE
jgi:hypothetical protein